MGLKIFNTVIKKLRRKSYARRIRVARELERNAFSGITSNPYELARGIKDLRKRTAFDPLDLAKGMVAERGKIQVLDVGCGSGQLLLDFHKSFGDSVELHGLRLTNMPHSPTEAEVRRVANIRLGLIENKKIQKKFDLITSMRTLSHVGNSVAALERICNHLKPGGVALLDLEKQNLFSKSIYSELKSQGFSWSITLGPKPHFVMLTLRKNTDKNVDFSKFY